MIKPLMTVAWSYIVWDGTRGKERDYLVCCVLHEEKLGSRGWFQAFDLDIAMLSLSKDIHWNMRPQFKLITDWTRKIMIAG